MIDYHINQIDMKSENPGKYDFPFPRRFVRIAKEILGEQRGSTWLTNIPRIVDNCATQWQCAFDPPFEKLSYNFVAPGKGEDGSDVAIKICIPGPEYATEADCLQEYQGDGALRLLARDDTNYAMLLERLLPGKTLTDHADSHEAIHIAARLMQRLWRPALHVERYPTVNLWIQHMAERSPAIINEDHLFPKVWIERALAIYDDIAKDEKSRVLLHGDLHMDNILSGERESWLVIDPKGVIGSPIWETGPLILNALPSGNDLIVQRAAIYGIVNRLASELSFDVHRVAAWGVVRAVLSGWWTVEDHGQGWEDSITIASILNELV